MVTQYVCIWVLSRRWCCYSDNDVIELSMRESAIPPLAVRPARCLSLLKPKIINRNTCIYLINFSFLSIYFVIPASQPRFIVRTSACSSPGNILRVASLLARDCWSQECTLQYGCGAFDRLYSSAAVLFPVCAIL